MIRVLIVDDSVTQREIFRRLLSADGEFSVIAEARNGKEAVEKVRTHMPDVVLMDIHMPDMDGIAATRAIMQQTPVPIVVASATLKKRDVDLALEAYHAGAVSVIEKPEGAVLLHLEKIAPQLRRELIAASTARLPARKERPARTEERRPTRVDLPPISAIGICASTGGPLVMVEILSALPQPFPVPVLLVQHISRGFEVGFAQWLARSSAQPVAMAVRGQRLTPGIWLAPGGCHLTLGSRARMELEVAKPSDIHAPSGDPLFRSLGDHLAPHAAGVLLTGMGDDGAAGLLALKRAGGTTIIQNEASSLIWGMPKAAKDKDAAQHVLNPTQIASLLAQMKPA
ncbi:MAG: chemotaxis-specific protein-glutamate methyltransferase CheB [Planctomycetes bacterium]|nr:chemotaxis-specific protein-glutamate methyltransferase CheB [Planctomycetota bacterium]